MSGLPSPLDRPRRPRRIDVGLHVIDAGTSPTATIAVDSRASGLRWTRRYRDRLWITDGAIIVSTLLVAVAVRVAVLGSTVTMQNPLERIGVPVLIAVTWLGALAAFRTRDPHILGTGATEYKRVVNATATAFGLLAILLLIIDVPGVRWYFVIAVPIGGATLLVGRWSWRKWLFTERRFGHYLSRAIVVGSRAEVEYVIAQIERNPAAGFHVVGAVVDDVDRSDVPSTKGNRVPVIAPVAQAADAASAHQADAVIVAGSLTGSGQSVRQLGWDLEGSGAELVLSSQLTDVAGPRIHFRPVEGLPLLHVEIPTFDGWRHVVKRTFDIVFAGTALVLLLPVLLLIALFIRLEGEGPILFRQTRCGRDGRTFEMLKFRSMVPTAERDLAGLLDRNEGAGVLFKMRNDPRVTRVGRFLRSYSLDELPQFWNILVGDMSVVGPRPPLQSEVDCYDGPVSRRLMIKPGLTGMWQISGRSDLTWEESVRLDLYYVENWSLAGDLMICWRTAKAVVKPEGAY